MGIGILVFIGALVLLWHTAAWILRPLDVAAKGRNLPLQFTLGDFLGLVFLIQLPTGALLLDNRLTWFFVVFGWFAFGLMWLAGVQTLSRAGVRNPWHRALFVGIVIPGAVAGSMAFVPLLGASLFGAIGPPQMDPGTWLLTVAATVGLGFVLFALGLATRRMLAARGRPKRPAPADPWDEDADDGPRRPAPSAPPDPFADDEPPAAP